MFKDLLAIIGAGFLIYHACKVYGDHVNKKADQRVADAIRSMQQAQRPAEA
jgi:hypothetical protein